MAHSANATYSCEARRARHQGRRTASIKASLPLLRRPNAHYRDLPAWAAATELPHAGCAKDQDRHLIRLEPMPDTHNDAHHLCLPCADNVTGRSFNPILSIGITQKRTIKGSKSPVARSRLTERMSTWQSRP